MRIPQVQQRLMLLSKEIRALAKELSRRPARDKAPTRSKPITPARAASIRALKRLHPIWSYQAIANAVGVNAGRVSEVLNGKRR